MNQSSWWRRFLGDHTKPSEDAGEASLPAPDNSNPYPYDPWGAEMKAAYNKAMMEQEKKYRDMTAKMTGLSLSSPPNAPRYYASSSSGFPVPGEYSDSQIETIKQAFNEPIEVEVKNQKRGVPLTHGLNFGDDDVITLVFGTGERASYTKGKWRGKDTELIKRISEKTGRAAIYPEDRKREQEIALTAAKHATGSKEDYIKWKQDLYDSKLWTTGSTTNTTNLSDYRSMNTLELESLIKERRAKMNKPVNVDFGIGKK